MHVNWSTARQGVRSEYEAYSHEKERVLFKHQRILNIRNYHVEQTEPD